MGRRTEGPGFSSVPTMSCPRLPARKPYQGLTLNSRSPNPGRGASIDGEDRVSMSVRRFPDGESGSNLLSGAGLFARLRGQAQVVAAFDSGDPNRHVAACATGGF
jgi:hypothetical protein